MKAKVREREGEGTYFLVLNRTGETQWSETFFKLKAILEGCLDSQGCLDTIGLQYGWLRAVRHQVLSGRSWVRIPEQTISPVFAGCHRQRCGLWLRVDQRWSKPAIRMRLWAVTHSGVWLEKWVLSGISQSSQVFSKPGSDCSFWSVVM